MANVGWNGMDGRDGTIMAWLGSAWDFWDGEEFS